MQPTPQPRTCREARALADQARRDRRAAYALIGCAVLAVVLCAAVPFF